jgi:hypothetical protein
MLVDSSVSESLAMSMCGCEVLCALIVLIAFACTGAWIVCAVALATVQRCFLVGDEHHCQGRSMVWRSLLAGGEHHCQGRKESPLPREVLV